MSPSVREPLRVLRWLTEGSLLERRYQKGGCAGPLPVPVWPPDKVFQGLGSGGIVHEGVVADCLPGVSTQMDAHQKTIVVCSVYEAKGRCERFCWTYERTHKLRGP
ncbi:hypothetical protein BIW11_03904 [Tropilaelaps mercedesae]|uniref:Uncharacterized protein n=1 Tax=Tropilaelaps mercedesae TaxID=418985 RepID=A0A1V9XED9_9ACAR|nr:hypothetical protein BIW11_03904 [Tropilaelaps mercedesae]